MGVGGTDIAELVKKAKIVAEATGRDEADILEDLLDDGVVNESNKEKDLVTQLKEAAELITTVQEINKDVSENTVLNGGENKTEVTLETTLEGDIVDRAIQSIQRKSENIKKLIITMIPLFLLLTGGGLEAFGVINMMDSEADSTESYGACLDPYAENYDQYASWDDGSCDFGVQIFPPCEPDWNYDDYSTQDDDVLFLKYTFFDENDCDIELEGHFSIVLLRNDSATTHQANLNVQFTDEIDIEYTFEDLEEGNYYWELEFHTIECEDGSCEHGAEYILDQKPTFHVEAEVILGCIDDTANNYYELATQDDGSCEYDPEIIEGCTNSTALNYDGNATDDDGTCEYPPEICGINLYSISLSSNSTQASVYFDLDCGYNVNNLSGYNVTVQFLVYELNGTNSGANATGPITYEVCTHYIEGWKADTIVLTLTNFTTNGVTNYDFYWYAMWTDGNGNGQIIEESWLNRELNP